MFPNRFAEKLVRLRNAIDNDDALRAAVRSDAMWLAAGFEPFQTWPVSDALRAELRVVFKGRSGRQELARGLRYARLMMRRRAKLPVEFTSSIGSYAVMHGTMLRAEGHLGRQSWRRNYPWRVERVCTELRQQQQALLRESVAELRGLRRTGTEAREVESRDAASVLRLQRVLRSHVGSVLVVAQMLRAALNARQRVLDTWLHDHRVPVSEVANLVLFAVRHAALSAWQDSEVALY